MRKGRPFTERRKAVNTLKNKKGGFIGQCHGSDAPSIAADTTALIFATAISPELGINKTRKMQRQKLTTSNGHVLERMVELGEHSR